MLMKVENVLFLVICILIIGHKEKLSNVTILERLGHLGVGTQKNNLKSKNNAHCLFASNVLTFHQYLRLS